MARERDLYAIVCSWEGIKRTVSSHYEANAKEVCDVIDGDVTIHYIVSSWRYGVLETKEVGSKTFENILDIYIIIEYLFWVERKHYNGSYFECLFSCLALLPYIASIIDKGISRWILIVTEDMYPQLHILVKCNFSSSVNWLSSENEQDHPKKDSGILGPTAVSHYPARRLTALSLYIYIYLCIYMISFLMYS